MDYPKRTPGIGLVGGKFADENASTGQPGSLIPATWGNAVTDELLAVIKAAGLTPSEDDSAQLLQAIQGLAASDVKRAVRVATTGPIALSGLQTLDGVALVAGDRVLVKDQANAAQNWIYTASAAAWSRALDANDDTECTPGHLIIVQAGTAYAGTMWQLSNSQPPQVGSTPLTFGMLFGKTGVAAGSYRQVAVDAMGRVTGGTNPTTLGGYGISDAYTQSEVNIFLGGKAAKATTLAGYGITDAYTSTAVDTALANKANKASTLSGYGITDAYNSTAIDNALAGKAAKSNSLSGYGIDVATQSDAEATSAPDNTRPMTALRVAQSIAKRVVQAGETVVGLCRFATLSDLVTGAPGYLAVCPAYLLAGFAFNFSENGYIRLPSWLGSLMFQWGSSDEATGPTDYRYFPVPFTSVVYVANLQLKSETTGGFGGNNGTVLQLVDEARYLWTAGGTFGGGGKGFIWAVGR